MHYLGYRFALCLTVILAVVNIIFFLYANSVHSHLVNSIAIYAVTSLILAFGLWVQSKIARYVGAIVCWLSVAAVAWPIVTGSKTTFGVGLLWVFSLGLLSFAIGYVLLFSRTFSNEFSYERKHQPRYKILLRNGAIIILTVAAAIATLNDIIHLANL